MKKGWIKTRLRDVATKIGSGATPLGGETAYKSSGISLIRSLNVHDAGFRMKDLAFIDDQQAAQLDNVIVEGGDVLLNITGASVARCCIVPDDIPTAINTKHICCVTLDRRQCLPGYLHIYFLHAPQSKEFLAKHAKGAIMAGLNMGLIQELPVMLPPIRQQTAIVEAADALATETQRLESLYQQKQAALTALKKSLLHQAFSGQL